MPETVSLKKYILIFFATSIIASIILAVILALLNVNSNAGASSGILFAYAYMAIYTFIMDNARPPNQAEKIRLIIYSFLTYWLVSIVLAIGVSVIYSIPLQTLLSSIPIQFLLFGFLFASLLTLLILWFSYGFMARKLHETLEKKGKI